MSILKLMWSSNSKTMSLISSIIVQNRKPETCRQRLNGTTFCSDSCWRFLIFIRTQKKHSMFICLDVRTHVPIFLHVWYLPSESPQKNWGIWCVISLRQRLGWFFHQTPDCPEYRKSATNIDLFVLLKLGFPENDSRYQIVNKEHHFCDRKFNWTMVFSDLGIRVLTVQKIFKMLWRLIHVDNQSFVSE